MNFLKVVFIFFLVLTLFSCQHQEGVKIVKVTTSKKRTSVSKRTDTEKKNNQLRSHQKLEKKREKECKPIFFVTFGALSSIKEYLRLNGDRVYLLLFPPLSDTEETLAKVVNILSKISFPVEKVVVVLNSNKKTGMAVFENLKCLKYYCQRSGIKTTSLNQLFSAIQEKTQERAVIQETNSRKSSKEVSQGKKSKHKIKNTRKVKEAKRAKETKKRTIFLYQLPYLKKEELKFIYKIKSALRKVVNKLESKSYAKNKERVFYISFLRDKCSIPKDAAGNNAYKEFDPEDFLFSYRKLAVHTRFLNYDLVLTPISILIRDNRYYIIFPYPKLKVFYNGKLHEEISGRLCGYYTEKNLILRWKGESNKLGIVGFEFIVPLSNVRFTYSGKLQILKTYGYIYYHSQGSIKVSKRKFSILKERIVDPMSVIWKVIFPVP